MAPRLLTVPSRTIFVARSNNFGGDPASAADGQTSGSGNGYQSILSGTHTSTSDPVSGKTQGRVDGGTSGPSSTISTDGNAMGTPTATAMATPINPGTSAEEFGSVTATGDVNVHADDNVAFGGIVGAAGGGAVGVGASVLVGLIDAIPIIGVGIAMYFTFVDPFTSNAIAHAAAGAAH